MARQKNPRLLVFVVFLGMGGVVLGWLGKQSQQMRLAELPLPVFIRWAEVRNLGSSPNSGAPRI